MNDNIRIVHILMVNLVVCIGCADKNIRAGNNLAKVSLDSLVVLLTVSCARCGLPGQSTASRRWREIWMRF